MSPALGRCPRVCRCLRPSLGTLSAAATRQNRTSSAESSSPRADKRHSAASSGSTRSPAHRSAVYYHAPRTGGSLMRRPWVVLVALAALMLAAAPAAYAQEPTITTDITFPEEGEPFGTFTATEPLCPSGTFVDEFVGGGGAFMSDKFFYGASTVRKMFTCADGSGTFTILFHPQFTPATAGGCDQAGPFAVIGGTGDYAQLRGQGDFCVFEAGEDEFSETFTGTF